MTSAENDGWDDVTTYVNAYVSSGQDYYIDADHYYSFEYFEAGWSYDGYSESEDVAVPLYPDPKGETSEFEGFQLQDYGDEGIFAGGIFQVMLLGHGADGAMDLDQGESYTGDTLQEYISGFSDECYFPDSEYNGGQRPSRADDWGSTWQVTNANGYAQPDFIGVIQGWVDYYRVFNVSCSESATQSMYVQGHAFPYATHSAGVGLYAMENGVAVPYAWRDNATGFDWAYPDPE